MTLRAGGECDRDKQTARRGTLRANVGPSVYPRSIQSELALGPLTPPVARAARVFLYKCRFTHYMFLPLRDLHALHTLQCANFSIFFSFSSPSPTLSPGVSPTPAALFLLPPFVCRRRVCHARLRPCCAHRPPSAALLLFAARRLCPSALPLRHCRRLSAGRPRQRCAARFRRASPN